MALHDDVVVDAAMRANIAAGNHFFDPDAQKFHKSRSITGVMSPDATIAYVVIRYRDAFMGGSQVQWPHSRVVRVGLKTGETEYMSSTGEVVSSNFDRKCEFSTNKKAIDAAKKFAGVVETVTVIS